ncbi:MAG: bifunctional serine/threonine-protein kinase/formylglycine-generating enzyme family protein [Planctomycetota bacterium]
MQAPPPDVHEPRPGDQLGDFRILHLLGQGAMGKVYEARQLSLQRRVALKVLPAEGGQKDQQQAVTRFYREARAAAQLQHPSIVPVYDFGFEQGCYYYAMQYVAGRPLQDMIHQGQVRDMKRIATWMLNVARALDSAHAQGVIHRDIKPANILVREEDDEALITDFGLARQERVKSITQAGALLGTPVYMAPEQARGEKATASIDIYALGATLYEALAGEVAFKATGLRELLTLITQVPPEPPSHKRPDVPPDLEAIALKALAKEPQARYATAKALADDLLRYLRGEPVEARGGNRAQRAWRRLERRPLLAALVALEALTLLLLILVAAWAPRRSRAQAAVTRLAEAQAALGEDLAAWRQASAELQSALAARDGAPRRRGEEAAGDPAVTRARLALGGVEERLGASDGPADPPLEHALGAAREALALAPPEHPRRAEARELLRDLLRLRAGAARRRGEDGLLRSAERELAALGERPGAVSLQLVTDPPDARVSIATIGEDERGWVLAPQTGKGALEALRPGAAYLLQLEAAGRVTVRLPLEVPALGAAELKLNVQLPPAGGIPPGFVYVAPGEILAGGDPDAVRPLFRVAEPIWVRGFFIAEREVTVGEFRDFLAAIPPRECAANLPLAGQLRLDGGRPVLAQEGTEQHPVAGVGYASALEYCRWRTSVTPGVTFGLPRDLEWEKAARGLARCTFPWGAQPPAGEPPLAQLQRYGTPAPEVPTSPVGSHPRDRSLYGVYDLGGNLCEWVDGAFGGDPRFRVLRGGSWARGPEPVRSTSREAVDPEAGFERIAGRVGFRLAFY